MKNFKILVINPGGGSTKVAIFENETELRAKNIRHLPEDLAKFDTTLDQLPYRTALVKEFLKESGLEVTDLDAVVSRGGAFLPLESGTYLISEKLIQDVKGGKVQTDHASNLGVLIAGELIKGTNIPGFFVDPVSVDEFDDISRLSGLKELPRKSLSHALNTKYVAKKLAKEVGTPYEKLRLIVAHLGTGISISPHRDGRMFDVNNANDGGPFSPQRAGSLPTTGLIELAFSGKYDFKSLMRKTIKEGGLIDYLGTDDLQEVERRITRGGKYAELVYRAMIYQIAKEIGAMAAALQGRVDYIIITGGMAHSDMLVEALKEYISWIAPVRVFPGENEMIALVAGVLRVLRGEELAREYTGEGFKNIQADG